MKFRWIRVVVAAVIGVVAWRQRHVYTAAYPAVLVRDLRNGHAAVILIDAGLVVVFTWLLWPLIMRRRRPA